MDSTIGLALLQAGLLLGLAVAAQVASVHLAHDVPEALRSRVTFSSRLNPWLGVAAAALTVVGVALLTWPLLTWP